MIENEMESLTNFKTTSVVLDSKSSTSTAIPALIEMIDTDSEDEKNDQNNKY